MGFHSGISALKVIAFRRYHRGQGTNRWQRILMSGRWRLNVRTAALDSPRTKAMSRRSRSPSAASAEELSTRKISSSAAASG